MAAYRGILAVVRTEGPLCLAHMRWPYAPGECTHETCWHVMFPLYILDGAPAGTGMRYAGPDLHDDEHGLAPA